MFFLIFIYLLLERGERKEEERKRNISVPEIHKQVASHTPRTGDLAHNPGMCPNHGLNQWPLGLQASAQSTEPHQPGHNFTIKKNLINKIQCGIQYIHHLCLVPKTFLSPQKYSLIIDIYRFLIIKSVQIFS